MKTPEGKVIFTREELNEKVRVPAEVEQDLKRIISDRLETCGLYHRVFSRTKTAASMERKFGLKDYGDDRKLQDLVGVRINLYFDDDVQICRSIIENTFDVVEWSTSERNEDEFKPAKLNSVCRLPKYLRDKISPETWDMSIDDTFEVQIKTMFFEGWHEIEHDLRYKGEELWKPYPAFSRFFNSILATLELCDKSMITLFEDLGHELYKSRQWSDMLRSHYRLKMGEARLYPEVDKILEQDQDENVDSLAKRLYKMDRWKLVELLLKRTRRVPVNVNTIVALINEAYFHDPRLTAVFKARDVYNDGREDSYGGTRRYDLAPLTRHSVFSMETKVDGSRMKGDNPSRDCRTIFELSAELLYRWVLGKYGELFMDMPPHVETYSNDGLAYRVSVDYRPQELEMKAQISHLDLDVGGRIWITEMFLRKKDGSIYLSVDNGYAEPDHEETRDRSPASFFSYPGCYKAVTDNVGIYNGCELSNRRRIIQEVEGNPVTRALRDKERSFPVILIVSNENEEGMMDEEWLDQFRVSDFTRTVWRYAHVFTCYAKVGREILIENGMKEQADQMPRLFVFWPDGDVDSYGPEEIKNSTFGRHLETRDDARTYDIVRSGQAFYHKLVTELREWNVLAQAGRAAIGKL
ncbi:MAG: hypothetical protein Q4B59_04625 [Lachnospiraceae bacterium]|nr:hypothetical protein [Lachnospiraceae bacterium]